MIISVTQVVIVGDRRVEKTAEAQIAGDGMLAGLADPEERARRHRSKIIETARALFESLEEKPA
jgi:hypothetical protein